jgi:hypothetical protein
MVRVWLVNGCGRKQPRLALRYYLRVSGRAKDGHETDIRYLFPESK